MNLYRYKEIESVRQAFMFDSVKIWVKPNLNRFKKLTKPFQISAWLKVTHLTWSSLIGSRFSASACVEVWNYYWDQWCFHFNPCFKNPRQKFRIQPWLQYWIWKIFEGKKKIVELSQAVSKQYATTSHPSVSFIAMVSFELNSYLTTKLEFGLIWFNYTL